MFAFKPSFRVENKANLRKRPEWQFIFKKRQLLLSTTFTHLLMPLLTIIPTSSRWFWARQPPLGALPDGTFLIWTMFSSLFFFFFFFFLWPYPWPMEVPRPGIESELPQPDSEPIAPQRELHGLCFLWGQDISIPVCSRLLSRKRLLREKTKQNKKKPLCMHPCVHCSTIHSSQDMETT